MLNILAANPNLSQRQIAAELSISVGKTNYCIKALADKGWIKARSVRNSDNKLAYAYVLTPSGIRRKKQLAVRFLEQKRQEFEALEQEIETLDAEVKDMSGDGSDGTRP
jgi:EPS-associated MarR family transcriptional regulator